MYYSRSLNSVENYPTMQVLGKSSLSKIKIKETCIVHK